VVGMHQENLNDVKDTVERAFKAAIFTMDYCILRVILDTSKEMQNACEKKEYKLMQYLLNKGLWDIGICIQTKINNYSSVLPEFFENILSNIYRHFKIESKVAFSPENLKRCFKLVELTSEAWFDTIAKWFPWEQVADALDKSNSFDELKTCLML
jgi:hypothetical protein